ncbi:MAG TPA: L,D-transpeptidase, partial [Thermomicrobiales bacterium]|nr:L,D-transpeptidase [Thermomicrobiales bacterium]
MLSTNQFPAGSRHGLQARMVGLVAILAIAATLLPYGARAQESSSELVYFDGTGQTLGGAFYDAWLNQGGLAEAGAPVSAAVQQGNRWVQWFEHTRLEVSQPTLDQAAAEDVQPGTIGMALAESFGLSRWHPAFQQVSGSVADGVRAFPNGHTLANAFLEEWETDDGEARLGAPISEEFSIGERVYQFFERGALSWTAPAGVEAVPLGYLDAAVNGNLQLGTARPEGVPLYNDGGGYSGGGGNWIDINLSNYTITAYEGGTLVFSSVIVDGGPATPTATGTFYTYLKLQTQTMEGPNTDGTTFIQEDVPWVMYFYADFAIHGAYWRYSFGYSG